LSYGRKMGSNLTKPLRIAFRITALGDAAVPIIVPRVGPSNGAAGQGPSVGPPPPDRPADHRRVPRTPLDVFKPRG